MKRSSILLFVAFMMLLMSACGTAKPTGDDVIAAFKNAGLEAENTRQMSKDDYGAAPLVCVGTRFFIPSLGENKGGRIFICNNNDDRDKLVEYYQELGKSSALFFSWVFVKDSIVVQINGDLKEEIARKYEKAIP